jgi:tRNA threonylcarbamoyladenosine biosynthesis protein TsaE
MRESRLWTVTSTGERDTLRLGATLGRVLKPGSVVALMGDLGSGKTRLTQGIALGLEVSPSDPVSSPSFALIHEHPARVSLYHMDFYRIPEGRWDPELGLEEYLWGNGACVIEWAERVLERLPDDRLEVRLTIEGTRKRRMEFVAKGEKHRKILIALQKGLEERSLRSLEDRPDGLEG